MSLFPTAKTPAKAKAPAAKKVELEVAVTGIQTLAEIKAMIANLESAAKTVEGEIKNTGFAELLAFKEHTESFKGIDGLASASIEMRKRSTASTLTAEEVEILAKAGLTAKTQITVAEMYGVNPTYATDKKMLRQVSKALEGIVPADFFIRQEEVSKPVVDDELLKAAFNMSRRAKAREPILRMLTTMALKVKLAAEYPLKDLQANVLAKLNPPADKSDELTAEAVALIAPSKKAAKKTAKV